jgi:hypothetical protein
MTTTTLSDILSSFISTAHAEEATHVEEFILLSADINDDPPTTVGLADIIEDFRDDTKSDGMLKGNLHRIQLARLTLCFAQNVPKPAQT